MVRLEQSLTCFVESTMQVVAPTSVEDTGTVSSGTLNDFDARVGMAFVAAVDGAFAVDDAGWVDLRVGIASGAIAPANVQAVAVHSGQPVFGPTADRDLVYRVVVDSPITSAVHTGIAIGGGGKAVRALAARVDDAGDLLAGTQSGAVVITDPGGTPSFDEVGDSYDPTLTGWAAIGTREPSSRGALWMGRADELVNRRSGAGSAFNDFSAAPTPADIRPVVAAAVDDRGAARRFWLCGQGGVRLYLFSGDWSALSTLPTPDGSWSGVCRDIAISEDGDAWVASGASLVRLGTDAAEIARYGEVEGLPTGATVDFVAAAWDATDREIWVLDATTRAVHVLTTATP
jgi:hypothetical protein